MNPLSAFRFKRKPVSSALLSPLTGTSVGLLSHGNMRKAPVRPSAPFGARERTVGDPEALFAQFREETNHSRERTAPIADWLRMLKTLQPFGPKGQLAGVNRYVNGSGHAGEFAKYARSKAWTLPVVMFPCEDGSACLALAKYVSLRILGFHADRLRMVWLTDKTKGDHAVLHVTVNGTGLILDDQTSDVLDEVRFQQALESTGETTPQPLFSLNGKSFKVHWPVNARKGLKKALDRLERRLRTKGERPSEKAAPAAG